MSITKESRRRCWAALLRGWRDEVVLATKAYYPTGPDRNARGSSRYHLVRAVEASLSRLATDRIDVYYLHHFDDVTDIGESLRALDDLVRQGKILYPACSNFAAWQVAHALGFAAASGLAPFCAVQRCTTCSGVRPRSRFFRWRRRWDSRRSCTARPPAAC
jgi:aryl-alcohol dehydrogenase-like predicted oxidoreductase